MVLLTCTTPTCTFPVPALAWPWGRAEGARMPSPIWSGTLTFALVAIPVQLVSASSSHKIAFRQVHTADMGPVKYRKTCEIDGETLEQGDIGRAYEAADGTLVPITDAELDELPLPTAKTIEVSGFLDLASVPGEMFDRPYFLTPSSPAGKKPYVLMREALARSGKAAVGKYAIRGGENLGVVYAAGDVLVLQRLRWPDELRAAGDAAPRGEVDLSEDELQAALDYVTALGDTDMAAFHDEYAAAVADLVTAKVEHADLPKREPKRRSDPAGPVDLMAALKAAADQARADRGEDADVHHMGERKASAKKTAARKATAKKAARKKAG